MLTVKNIFISYRIESEAQSQQVISFADQLRADGMNAIIDRYIEAPTEGWPRWIGRMIANSDVVVCVCSAGYREAFEGRNESDGGLGVNAEGYHIMQDLYDHRNESDKYVPVFFVPPSNHSHIPAMLRAFRSYMLPAGYEDLYRRLTGQPSVKQPGLGPLKELPPLKKAPPLSEESVHSEGFEGQAGRHYSITPHDYSLKQLAPSEGIHISRIINPPDRYDPKVITTVWVAARGEDQYIIESMRNYGRNILLSLRDKFKGFLQARESLHTLLNTETSLSQLGQWLAQGYEFAADLLGGIGTEGATRILLDTLSREPANEAALNGLCVRHFMMGDDVLAEYALTHKEALVKDKYVHEKPLFAVFLLRPTGKFPAVVEMIQEAAPDYIVPRINSRIALIRADISEESFFAYFDTALGPLGVPVFIRGTMNDWGSHSGADAQLIHKGKGMYEVILQLKAMRYEFKIADRDWIAEINFGSDAPDQVLDLDTPQQLSVSNLSHNLVLDLSETQTGLYRFIFDTNDSTGPTLTISYWGSYRT
jgi:hypothetical protein